MTTHASQEEDGGSQLDGGLKDVVWIQNAFHGFVYVRPARLFEPKSQRKSVRVAGHVLVDGRH